jgi:hypothetical protein
MLMLRPSKSHSTPPVSPFQPRLQGTPIRFTMILGGAIKPAYCLTLNRKGDSNVEIIIFKAEVGPFWPYLDKAKTNSNKIKADWSKWVDDDEDGEKPDFDMFGFAGMDGGFGSGKGQLSSDDTSVLFPAPSSPCVPLPVLMPTAISPSASVSSTRTAECPQESPSVLLPVSASGCEMLSTLLNPIPQNHFLGTMSFPADSDLIVSLNPSIIAALCDSDGVGNHDSFCATLCARLDQVMSNDSVAVLRGREFTVKRSSAPWSPTGSSCSALKLNQTSLELTLSNATKLPAVPIVFVSVASLQKHNADRFQAVMSNASAADSTAQIPPLYRAELLYMLACQEPTVENKDHAVFTVACARTAYSELCRMRGDAHADTLSCLATLAVHLSEHGEIDEAWECFAKCCEGRAAALGEDCEATLSIRESFANFLKDQQEYDAARSLLLECF